MKLEHSFEVAAPLERVWKALIDVEYVAPCLPGAAVTGRDEEGGYTGSFSVKLGPTTAAYNGTLHIGEVDEAAHRATLHARGTDKRGQGGATATIVNIVSDAGSGITRVEAETDFTITGRLARFGRGGMIEDISNRLLREFAECLQAKLVAGEEAAAAEPPAVEEPPAPVEEPPAAGEAPPAAVEEPPGAVEAPPRAVEVPPAAVEEPPAVESPAKEEPAPVTWISGAPISPPPPPQPEPVAGTHVDPFASTPEPVAAEPEPEPVAAAPELVSAAAPEPPVAPAAEPPPPRTGSIPPPSYQAPAMSTPTSGAKPVNGFSLFFSVLWERIKKRVRGARKAR